MNKAHHAIAYTCLGDRYGAYGSAARIILGAEKEFGKPFVEEMRSLFPRLFRDIFGNPFRPLSINQAWLQWNDGAVVKIARRVYERREFGLLPILCDALEEAGCGDEQIIKHCRLEKEHVRGCWLVDRLLGKK